MMYAHWLALATVDLLLLPVWYLGAPVVSAFTRTGDWHGLQWFGTYDNPPQGDSNWLEDHPASYVNRVGWLWRNPGYSYQRWVSVKTPERYRITLKGNPDISDKYRRPGWYFAKLYNGMGKQVAWEFYCVLPYSRWPGRCFRMRLGYKVLTDKVDSLGFAPLVNTANPFKSYGKR